MKNSISKLKLENGKELAYQYQPGTGPAIVFLGGYASDMSGTKAEFLASYCAKIGKEFIRFDYSGHGQSNGDFDRGTIGQWKDDAIAVIQHCTSSNLLLVGSSMGGWIMLLIATLLKDRIHSLIGIAAAPDFSEDLMWSQFDKDTQNKLYSDGIIYLPSEYNDEGIPLRKEFIDDGRCHLVLRKPIELQCPIRLLHGLLDKDVPWQTAEKILHTVVSIDVQISYVKNADHRFSAPTELNLLASTLDQLIHDVP